MQGVGYMAGPALGSALYMVYIIYFKMHYSLIIISSI